MSDEIKIILDNPFSTVLIDRFSFVLGINKREGFDSERNNHHLLSETEKYTLKIVKLQNNLTNTIEQVQFIKIFIQRFPLKDFYAKNNINQLNYIQYHVEILIHKIHTISEIMKLMVNDVYDLGISPEKCSWKLISSKLNKNNLSLIIIEEYFNVFEKIISVRHLNSHRGVFDDKNRDEIDIQYGFIFYDSFEKRGADPGLELKRIFPPILLNHKIKEYRKKNISLINNCQSHIHVLIKDFLSSLHEKYIEKVENES